MKRKIIIGCVIVVVLGLLVFGIRTGVLTGKILPALGKIAKAVPPKMWVGFLFKLLILTGLMGYITKLMNARKERFLNGEVEYRPQKHYWLIVGYDFQTRPLIKRILTDNPIPEMNWCQKTVTWCARKVQKLCGTYRPSNCVLLITNRDVRAIRAEMATELTKEESKRLLYMRRDLALERTYAGLDLRCVDAIYMIGDEGVAGRDGVLLQAADEIARKTESEIAAEKEDLAKLESQKGVRPKQSDWAPIRVYLQFDDPGFYSQMCTRGLPLDRKGADGKAMFDLELFNYYDSWVWKCWSEKDSVDGDEPYLPIRFKPKAERVELFVIGSGRAAKAVVDTAVTLMNYGAATRRCRLTVVTDREIDILPSQEVIDALPELEIVAYSMRDLNRVVVQKMVKGASDEKTAVTIVIVEDAPEKTTKTYLGLPFALHNLDVSVLLWMGTQSRNLPKKNQLMIADKYGETCDKIRLRYFGMSDCPPWVDSDRHGAGIAVNYYYTDCYEDQRLPKGEDVALLSASKSLWNEKKAQNLWKYLPRWAKNSNNNSAGCFKEKAALVGGRTLTPELQHQLLVAEHNRWWAERLLGGWRLGAKADGKKDEVCRLHPNLVPFDDLDESTKDIDKLCIAAMARQGFIG